MTRILTILGVLLLLAGGVFWYMTRSDLPSRPVPLPARDGIGAPVPLPDEQARQFDFWLGEWDVQNKHVTRGGSWNDTGSAIVRVQPVVDGGAVLEQWKGTVKGNPLIGFSLRAYDPALDRWVIWLNWHGGTPGGFFRMDGSRVGDRIEQFPPDDRTALRYSFTNAFEDSAQWEEARSRDGGDSWITTWVMQLTRRSPALAVDAANMPVVEPPAGAEQYPSTRELDFLIGAWEGSGRVRTADGEWQELNGRARVTSMIDGFGLLQFVDTSDGGKSHAAMAHDATVGGWRGVRVDNAVGGLRTLAGETGENRSTFTTIDGVTRTRERWSCLTEDGCSFTREASTDSGATWAATLELQLGRSASTAAFVDFYRSRAPFADILTGGQVDAEQLEWAARNGYRTVVNLRTPGEEGELPDEAAIVEGLGMRYVHIPVAGGDGINAENARLLAAALDESDALPAIVHCRSGGRVGSLFAIKSHEIDGLPPEQALQVGRDAGMSGSEPLVRKILNLPEK